ncbi:MAG: glycosyltransferase [Gaiellaceae bacterium]
MPDPAGQEPYCSLIVPTYRRPRQLAECLESLADLDYPCDRFEVIVVDDGGGVSLEPVLERFRGELRLSLLVTDHGGPAAARNAAAARARGELLVFTDDDCRPAPSWLRLLAMRYRSEPRSAFGGHTVNALVEDPYSSTSQLVIDVGYAHLNLGNDTALFFTTNNLAVPASGFRALGGLDASYRTAEDRDFSARWVARGWRLEYVPEAIVRHAHGLTLTSFCRQHFAYGRGAFRFHRDQARRSNRRIRIDPSYYRALARAPFRRERPARALTIAALLGVWHGANTAGFLFEWARSRDGGARPDASRCRVLHLTWSGQIGGIERQLATVVRAAHDRNPGAMHICFLDGRGAVAEELAAEGLATRLWLEHGWDPRGLWRLWRTARRIRPEIVHLHTHALGSFAVATMALPRASRIYSEHSPRALAPEDRKFRLLYRLVRKSCTSVVALAPPMARALERHGVEPKKIALIPYAVAVPRGTDPDRGDADTIGVVCRLAPVKRVDLLIDVVGELRRRGVDCSALIVGDGPERERLEAHAVTAGVAGHVRFVGEQHDVLPWLDALDVFLMTSLTETFGLAPLEAMARGVPVVAMPCAGGLADLAARGGLLLPDRKVTTAAEAVARLLRSRDERKQLRARGYQVARRHSPESVLSKFDMLYAAAPVCGGRSWTQRSVHRLASEIRRLPHSSRLARR